LPFDSIEKNQLKYDKWVARNSSILDILGFDFFNWFNKINYLSQPIA